MASSSSPHHTGNPSIKFPKVQDKEGKMTIPAKDLNIVWGGDSRYWKILNDNSPAELYQVCWLEVTSSVDGINPNKNYEVGFQVSLTPDAFGWGKYPLYVMVRRGRDGQLGWTKFHMNPDEKGKFEIRGKLTKPENRGQESSGDKLYFGLYEAWSGKWKGGLKIHHAFVKEST